MAHIVVIGGGPGGTAAATRAAQLGAQVTLIEKEHLGGACVNENCIPLTGMLASVELLDKIRRAGALGIRVGSPELDVAQAREHVQNIVLELREGIRGLMGSFGVTVIDGEATLENQRTVRVGGQSLLADAIILATGAVLCPAPFAANGWLTPRQALALDQPPVRLLVWGSGAIEVEYAQYFALQGSQVVLVSESPGILPEEDYEVGQRLQSILNEQGIQVLTKATVKEARSTANGAQFVISQRKGDMTLEVDRWLSAGFQPAVAGLGLEKIGVRVTSEALPVDKHCMTNVPGVYAIGDVAGNPRYSYVATVQGLVAAENAVGQTTRGALRRLDLRAMPRCIYTIPEVACVGLTEAEAEDRGYEVEVVNTSQATNVRAMTMDEAVGGIKTIFDKKYGKVLGVHIVGHRAIELIAEAALGIQLEATAEDFAWAVRGHPTLSETMVETGRAFFGQALYIPKW